MIAMELPKVLLTDKEIGVILRQCDCSMVPLRHNIEEPDEYKEIAKAQLKKVMDYLNARAFVWQPTGESATVVISCDWQALLNDER